MMSNYSLRQETAVFRRRYVRYAEVIDVRPEEVLGSGLLCALCC